MNHCFILALSLSWSQLGRSVEGESGHMQVSYIAYLWILHASVLFLGKDLTANVQLENGGNGCQGLVKFLEPSTNSSWSDCSSWTTGESEASVICRQIGCITGNAKAVKATR